MIKTISISISLGCINSLPEIIHSKQSKPTVYLEYCFCVILSHVQHNLKPKHLTLSHTTHSEARTFNTLTQNHRWHLANSYFRHNLKENISSCNTYIEQSKLVGGSFILLLMPRCPKPSKRFCKIVSIWPIQDNLHYRH